MNNWTARTWTKAEEKWLTENYSRLETYELEKELQRQETSIYMRANKLGLKKRIKK